MVNKKGKRKKQAVSKKTSKKRAAKKEVKDEMDKAQVWSIDVLLAVVIFIAVILVFYTTMNQENEKELKDLESEAGNVKTQLEKNHEIGFISTDQVNETKMKDFVEEMGENYSKIKQKLGLRGDFCIFYEDSEGNIIYINDSGAMKIGVGDSNIKINEIPCGNPVI